MQAIDQRLTPSQRGSKTDDEQVRRIARCGTERLARLHPARHPDDRRARRTDRKRDPRPHQQSDHLHERHCRLRPLRRPDPIAWRRSGDGGIRSPRNRRHQRGGRRTAWRLRRLQRRRRLCEPRSLTPSRPRCRGNDCRCPPLVESRRPPQPHDQGPGNTCGRGGSRGAHCRRRQCQRHTDVLARSLRGSSSGLRAGRCAGAESGTGGLGCVVLRQPGRQQDGRRLGQGGHAGSTRRTGQDRRGQLQAHLSSVRGDLRR